MMSRGVRARRAWCGCVFRLERVTSRTMTAMTIVMRHRMLQSTAVWTDEWLRRLSATLISSLEVARPMSPPSILRVRYISNIWNITVGMIWKSGTDHNQTSGNDDDGRKAEDEVILVNMIGGEDDVANWHMTKRFTPSTGWQGTRFATVGGGVSYTLAGKDTPIGFDNPSPDCGEKPALCPMVSHRICHLNMKI